MINIVIYVLMLLTGLYAYCVCAWISFRYFMATIKIFAIACLSLIQGFAGSRRLSGYAGGFLSQAITVGLDFFLSTVLVGIFYGLVLGIIQNTALWPLVANMLRVATGPGLVGTGAVVVHTAVSLGTLLLIDVALTLWAYLMAAVPQLVGDTMSGRVDISAREAVQTFRSSPTIGGQLMGGAGRTLQGAAERGPLPAAWNQAQRAAPAAYAGASSPTRGTGMGYVDGALRGAAVGGLGGALAGVAGAWVGGGFVPAKTQEPTASASAPEADNDVTTTRTSASGTPERSGSSGRSGSGSDGAQTVKTGTYASDPQQPSDTSIGRRVTIEDQYDENGDPNDAPTPGTASAGEQRVSGASSSTFGGANANGNASGNGRPAGSAFPGATNDAPTGSSGDEKKSTTSTGIGGAVNDWVAARGGVEQVVSDALNDGSLSYTVENSMRHLLNHKPTREQKPNAFPESRTLGPYIPIGTDLRGK